MTETYPPTVDARAGSGWRSVLSIHPAAEMFPLMSPDELRVTSEDIKKNGLQVPITVIRERGGEAGEWSYQLLDGRNRLDAIELAGFSTIAVGRSRGRAHRRREGMECGLDLLLGLPDEGVHEWRGAIDYISPPDDPYAYVISANIHRRHLDAEQRRDLLIKLIARAPEKSDRQIAKEAGVDHKTIAKARAKGVDVGSVPHVSTRIDTRGRQQPARTKIVRDQGGPELIKAVEAGEVSVSAAVDSIRPRPPSAASRSKPRSPAGKALKLTRHDVVGWLSTAPVEECHCVFNAVGGKRMDQIIPLAWSLVAARESCDQIADLHRQVAALRAELQQRDVTIRRLHRQLETRPGGVFGISDESTSPPAQDDADGLDVPAFLRRGAA